MIDVTREQLTNTTTIASGTGTALWAGFDLSEIGIIIGTSIAILSYLTNLYFHCRRDKRESLRASRMRNNR